MKSLTVILIQLLLFTSMINYLIHSVIPQQEITGHAVKIKLISTLYSSNIIANANNKIKCNEYFYLYSCLYS